MSLKNKSVLVTGGAGFIGSHLVDRVIRDDPDNVVVVDNFFLGKNRNLGDARADFENLRIYREDASNLERMSEITGNANVDVLFNLAAIPLPASLRKPRWTFEQNVNITLTVCEMARKELFETLVHFSSSEAYGTSEYAPMDETHPLNATTPYAASKAASDLLVHSYCKTFGIDASIVRPFNNYGPRQNEGTYAGVIPRTIRRILNGEPPMIYGDGKQTRDYLYVTDTVQAAILVYDSKATRGRVLNVASGREVSIETLISIVAKQLDCHMPVVYEPERPGDVARHIANIYLAEDILGFSPTVDLDRGLELTIAWYRKHLSPDLTEEAVDA